MVLFMFLGVLGMNLLACLLILLRKAIYHTKLYTPMLKNLALSFFPGVLLLLCASISLGLIMTDQPGLTKPTAPIGVAIGVLGFFFWLLFLPNSGYLITELNFNHRGLDEKEVPFFYDLIAVLSLAVSGIFNTCLNVVFIQAIYIAVTSYVLGINHISQYSLSWVIVVGLFLLVSIGIYFGRYIRFNSWDVLKPSHFIKKIRDHFRLKENRVSFLLYALLYTLFFSLFYLTGMATILPDFFIFLFS